MHATTAALLAQARSAQGRYDDAAALTETVARDAAPEDVVTQALWRSVRAGVLARRGATDGGRGARPRGGRDPGAPPTR